MAPRRRWLLLAGCGAMALAAGLLFTRGIQAQVLTVRPPGNRVQPPETTRRWPGNTNVAAYPFRGHRRLVITDLVGSAPSNPTVVGLSRGGTAPPLFFVPVTPSAPFE